MTYELPFGRGKWVGASWNKVLNNIAGNWQVNGILTLSKGQPLRLRTLQNTAFSFGGIQTPDTTGINADLGSARTIDRWFDTTQYFQPKDFTFGTVGRNHPNLRNDGARNLDFSVFKEFRYKERLRAELRGEAFNLANHPLFGRPGETLNTATFGVVTGQENSPRQVQLGLKILF